MQQMAIGIIQHELIFTSIQIELNATDATPDIYIVLPVQSHHGYSARAQKDKSPSLPKGISVIRFPRTLLA